MTNGPAAGFVGGLSGWANGDFDYDGTVDGADYALRDNAFDLEASSLAKSAGVIGTEPEPASLAVVVLTAAAARRRRR